MDDAPATASAARAGVRRGAPLESDEISVGFDAIDAAGEVVGELRALPAEASDAERRRFEALSRTAAALHDPSLVRIVDISPGPDEAPQCLLELDGSAPFAAIAALASREHAVPPKIGAWVVRDVCAAARALSAVPDLVPVAAALELSSIRLDRTGRARVDPARAIARSPVGAEGGEAAAVRALGALLYRLTTGSSAVGSRPPAPGEIIPGYPDELDDAVVAALRAGSDGGLSSIDALIEALGTWLESVSASRDEVVSWIAKVLERVPPEPAAAKPARPVSLRDGIGLGRLLDRRYRLDRVLGSGGMGVVFAATHVPMQRSVAVKMLMPRIAGRGEVVMRFLREARIAGALSHPGLAAVYDVGEDQGAYYLVMELLEGETLRALLDRRGALPLLEVMALVRPLAAAIAHAHARGVVHRDLKPDNVFIRTEPDGSLTPKLLDFGIGKPLDAEPVTLTGAIVGTPLYLAPEQVRSEPVDVRTDVYQLGALLFEMLAGGPPYAAQAMAPLMVAITTGERRAIGDRVRGLPLPVAAVVERSLSVDPSDRYPDVDAQMAALEAALTAPDAAPPGARPDRQVTTPWVWTACIAALAAAAGFMVGHRRVTEPPARTEPPSPVSAPVCPAPAPTIVRLAGSAAPVTDGPRSEVVESDDGAARCTVTVSPASDGALEVRADLVTVPVVAVVEPEIEAGSRVHRREPEDEVPEDEMPETTPSTAAGTMRVDEF